MIKFFFKLAGLPVFYSGLNESSLAPNSNDWTIPLTSVVDPDPGPF